MTDVDRYLTDEAVQAAYGAMRRMAVESYDDAAKTVLGAALPAILAQHRADVLREAADYIDLPRRADSHDTRELRRMADEAVTE